MLNWSKDKENIGGATNSSFISLIPKEKNPSSIKWFGPISLFHSSYKILTKVISSRLKKFISKLILDNQGGFIAGRQIVDNIFTIHEAIDSSHKRKEATTAIKLDLENTFDRIRHEFIFLTLGKFEFSANFVNWIKSCIISPWIASLVNSRPTDFFILSRGIHQGFPLSPFHYILVEDSLSRGLNWLM